MLTLTFLVNYKFMLCFSMLVIKYAYPLRDDICNFIFLKMSISYLYWSMATKYFWLCVDLFSTTTSWFNRAALRNSPREQFYILYLSQDPISSTWATLFCSPKSRRKTWTPFIISTLAEGHRFLEARPPTHPPPPSAGGSRTQRHEWKPSSGWRMILWQIAH